jgi:prepilin-type processing-associated H-X9-DG protein
MAEASAAGAKNAEGTEQMLRRLEWTVIRRLDGLLQGDWRTLWRGAGVDLADLREYQPHDDVRHIDWNVTARLHQPYVREHLEDRELTAWFLLDVSGSVDFGSGTQTKLELASAFVATLARVITRHGNRVGALFYDGQAVVGMLPPRATRLHVLELLQRMRTPPAKPVRGPAPTAAALGDLLRAAVGAMRRRSLVFVVSDFISAPGWEAHLTRLAQRHDVVAVRLWDALEMALPADAGLGLVTLEDAETGEQLFIDASDPGFRRRYAEIAQAREAELLASLARSGADTLELATDDALMEVLMRFVDLRKQRARLPAGRRFPRGQRRAVPTDALLGEAAA